MAKTSWLLFALMKLCFWQLYICNEMHCPSCVGWRAVRTRWFLFVLSVCYWENGGNTASVKQRSSSLSQAGDYLCSTGTLLSALLSCRALLKKTHWGLTCRVKHRDVMKLFCTKLCWGMENLAVKSGRKNFMQCFRQWSTNLKFGKSALYILF